MVTIAEFIKEDMEKRGMSIREYATFIGSTHPTVIKYIEGNNQIQWGFLVSLSRSTHIDIGTLARMAAPDVAVSRETISDESFSFKILEDRIRQLPPTYRKIIVDMIDGLLYQQQRTKDSD